MQEKKKQIWETKIDKIINKEAGEDKNFPWFHLQQKKQQKIVMGRDQTHFLLV